MKKQVNGPGALFMEEFGRHLIIADDGQISFTARGKKELGALFARYGLNLNSITTLEQFQRCMREVNVLEADRTERELENSLRDPQVSEADKAFIRSMLGLPEPTPRPSAQIFDLAKFRSERKSSQ